jgi:hypothetical protein
MVYSNGTGCKVNRHSQGIISFSTDTSERTLGSFMLCMAVTTTSIVSGFMEQRGREFTCGIRIG